MLTWLERTAQARGRGEYTRYDKEDVLSWRTCAIGEQWQQLPHVVRLDNCDQPVDEELFRLGSATYHLDHKGFAGAVLKDDFDLAEALLEKIQDRVLVLKREATDG